MHRFLFIIFFSSIVVSCYAQADIQKVQDEFYKDLADTNSIVNSKRLSQKYYSIRGFNMYCETFGKTNGQPLLLIHGNGGEILSFLFQIPYFSQKYKVIVAESRAQGRSVDNSDTLSYEMMADDYNALLDSMKLDSAYVIGWSDGGINGLLLALRHPKKVKKLATVGANLTPDTTAIVASVFSQLTSDYQQLAKKANRSKGENNSLKLIKLECTQPHIPIQALHNIQCPTLVIGGDHDVIKEEHTILIYKNIPNAYLWIVPASGHAVSMMYKDDFNAVVSRFLSQPYKMIEGQSRFN